MKKTIVLLMLVTSITAELCAQSNRSDKSFEVPTDVIMNRRFTINLDKGNKLQLEMTDITDFVCCQ